MRKDITKGKEFTDKLSKMQKQLIQQNVNLITQVEDKTAELIKSERLATIGTMASSISVSNKPTTFTIRLPI